MIDWESATRQAEAISHQLHGVHKELDFDQYRQLPFMNWSTLKHFGNSPRHAQAVLRGENPKEETDSMREGSALHHALLEPDKFAEYELAGQCSAVLTTGENAGAQCEHKAKHKTANGWRCGQHANRAEKREPNPRLWLPEKRHSEILRSVETLKQNSYLAMLRSRGWAERTIVWEEDGVTYKARLDRYSPPIQGRPPLILDLKSIGQVPTHENCAKQILNMGYHRQMALYQRGIEQLTGLRPEVVLVFVETHAPYDLNVIPIDTASLSIGWLELEPWIRMAKLCLEKYGSNDWPGVMHDAISVDNETIKYGGLPPFYRRKYKHDDRVLIDDNQLLRRGMGVE